MLSVLGQPFVEEGEYPVISNANEHARQETQFGTSCGVRNDEPNHGNNSFGKGHFSQLFITGIISIVIVIAVAFDNQNATCLFDPSAAQRE